MRLYIKKKGGELMEIIPKDKWIQYFAVIGIVTMGIMAVVQSQNLQVSYKTSQAYSNNEKTEDKNTLYELTPTVTQENESDNMY